MKGITVGQKSQGEMEHSETIIEKNNGNAHATTSAAISEQMERAEKVEDIMKDVMKRVQETRERLGYTRKQLARLVGVKEKSIYNWENCLRAVSASDLTAMALAMNLDPSVFWSAAAADKERSRIIVDMEIKFKRLQNYVEMLEDDFAQLKGQKAS